MNARGYEPGDRRFYYHEQEYAQTKLDYKEPLATLVNVLLGSDYRTLPLQKLLGRMGACGVRWNEKWMYLHGTFGSYITKLSKNADMSHLFEYSKGILKFIGDESIASTVTDAAKKPKPVAKAAAAKTNPWEKMPPVTKNLSLGAPTTDSSKSPRMPPPGFEASPMNNGTVASIIGLESLEGVTNEGNTEEGSEEGMITPASTPATPDLKAAQSDVDSFTSSNTSAVSPKLLGQTSPIGGMPVLEMPPSPAISVTPPQSVVDIKHCITSKTAIVSTVSQEEFNRCRDENLRLKLELEGMKKKLKQQRDHFMALLQQDD